MRATFLVAATSLAVYAVTLSAFGTGGVLAIAACITLGFSLTAATNALRSSSVAGIARSTWVMQLVGAFIYVIWSATHGLVVALTTATVDVVCSLLILGKIEIERRRTLAGAVD